MIASFWIMARKPTFWIAWPVTVAVTAFGWALAALVVSDAAASRARR